MSTVVDGERKHTPEDLLAMPNGDRFELVDGRLIEPNVSNLSSIVAGQLGARLTNHANEEKAGWVFPSDAL